MTELPGQCRRAPELVDGQRSVGAAASGWSHRICSLRSNSGFSIARSLVPHFRQAYSTSIGSKKVSAVDFAGGELWAWWAMTTIVRLPLSHYSSVT